MMSHAEAARISEERSIAAAAERARVKKLEDHVLFLEKVIDKIEEDQPGLVEWAEYEVLHGE